MVVFVIQIIFAVSFCLEQTNFDRVETFSMTSTFFQVVASVLITMEFSKEIYSATKILTYLKRTKSNRSKIINVLLASMQLFVPIVTMISYMINVIQ